MTNQFNEEQIDILDAIHLYIEMRKNRIDLIEQFKSSCNIEEFPILSHRLEIIEKVITRLCERLVKSTNKTKNQN